MEGMELVESGWKMNGQLWMIDGNKKTKYTTGGGSSNRKGKDVQGLEVQERA